jgi:hypothetical protein
VAKILGVDTEVLLYDSEFYFPLSSLFVHKSHKSWCTYVVSASSDGFMFAQRAGFWDSILNQVIFFNHMSIIALEAVTFNFFLNL